MPAFSLDNDDAHIVMTSEEFALMMAKARLPDTAHNGHSWIMDSGCSPHMTFDSSAFVTYTELVVRTKQEAKVAGRGDVVINFSVGGKQHPHVFVGCIYGKVHEAPIQNLTASLASADLDLVHPDVVGQVNVPSIGGSRYLISFTDDYSK